MHRTDVSHARWIGFTTFTSSAGRRSSCGLVNAELFVTLADGSGKAIEVTSTYGTSTEAWPSWGW